MKEVFGSAKTVREILNEVKYSIDYYRIEYKDSLNASYGDLPHEVKLADRIRNADDLLRGVQL